MQQKQHDTGAGGGGDWGELVLGLGFLFLILLISFFCLLLRVAHPRDVGHLSALLRQVEDSAPHLRHLLERLLTRLYRPVLRAVPRRRHHDEPVLPRRDRRVVLHPVPHVGGRRQVLLQLSAARVPLRRRRLVGVRGRVSGHRVGRRRLLARLAAGHALQLLRRRLLLQHLLQAALLRGRLQPLVLQALVRLGNHALGGAVEETGLHRVPLLACEAGEGLARDAGLADLLLDALLQLPPQLREDVVPEHQVHDNVHHEDYNVHNDPRFVARRVEVDQGEVVRRHQRDQRQVLQLPQQRVLERAYQHVQEGEAAHKPHGRVQLVRRLAVEEDCDEDHGHLAQENDALPVVHALPEPGVQEAERRQHLTRPEPVSVLPQTQEGAERQPEAVRHEEDVGKRRVLRVRRRRAVDCRVGQQVAVAGVLVHAQLLLTADHAGDLVHQRRVEQEDDDDDGDEVDVGQAQLHLVPGLRERRLLRVRHDAPVAHELALGVHGLLAQLALVLVAHRAVHGGELPLAHPALRDHLELPVLLLDPLPLRLVPPLRDVHARLPQRHDLRRGGGRLRLHRLVLLVLVRGFVCDVRLQLVPDLALGVPSAPPLCHLVARPPQPCGDVQLLVRHRTRDVHEAEAAHVGRAALDAPVTAGRRRAQRQQSLAQLAVGGAEAAGGTAGGLVAHGVELRERVRRRRRRALLAQPLELRLEVPRRHHLRPGEGRRQRDGRLQLVSGARRARRRDGVGGGDVLAELPRDHVGP
eukprot:Rhum_TRINITY_DN14117_c11_g1::Rhum_TRINITY_DN14117_c11_g1_i1::g.72134::m.72134